MQSCVKLAVLPVAALLLGTTGAMAEDDGERRAAYLAGPCASCHSDAVAEQAIPGLHGKDPEDFRAAMQAFKSGQRQNRIMAAVAASLGNEEFDLLARYFAAQRREGDAP